MLEYVNEDWRDKIAAQERHEHLAATVRVVVGELLYAAEKTEELDTAEKLYGIVEVLDAELKEGAVAYTQAETVPAAMGEMRQR